jgi:hypothetical protein
VAAGGSQIEPDARKELMSIAISSHMNRN